MPDLQDSILIVGAGTFGLSAAYHFTRAGYKSITILEKGTSVPSSLSAGNDVNKIVRAEYEDPFYTELALQAMSEWADNELFAPHYHQTGYLLANSAAAPEKTKKTLAKSLESIRVHPAWAGRINPIKNREDIAKAAPALDGPMEGWEGYFNQFAGYAHAANALKAVYEYVKAQGVEIHTGENVASLTYDGDKCIGARTTSGKDFKAATTILTVGASLGNVLPSVGRQVTAKAWSVLHIQLQSEEAARLKGIPVTYARDLGFFFEPEPGTGILKLSPSGGGYTNYSTTTGLSTPPEKNDFVPEADVRRIRKLLQETLPGLADRPFVDQHICWCADTADSDYVIDAVPGKKGLYLATGDSGHGFKMLPVVGQWIKDLVEKGKQDIVRWKWKEGSDAGQNVSWRADSGHINFPGKTSATPGEEFEVRQTSTTEDYHPNPSKSIPLSPARQRLIDDIIALYSMEPTVERVKRYTADCVYDDQFVYANDRYKMAGQWFALPKLFKASVNEGYEIVKNDRDLIQFRNEQSWTFKLIPKTATINALVSLSLDPGTVDSDFIQVKYHKDQANDKDYSHEGVGFSFKKWQADNVIKVMDSKEVEAFAADKDAGKNKVKKYGTGKTEGDAPIKDL
ncbi:FAD dependent oxidoreductase [Colletotrichum paranaense]|uniref:FAD dependent oxidoreductase n=1 Tax=Colletotrichum paranaense TaxID=1914294 RepID=A0ABQ9SNU6_9PEZI|nr:FAD dependent oxidoreductase [Colletotrichum paranaense]KAK1541180.1 FAD dependent oxidoreductase [Colletotrichum paranaense]